MNCKQGDIAIVVGGKYNLGKVVTCIRQVPMIEVQLALKCAGMGISFIPDTPYWEVDNQIVWKNGSESSQVPYIQDSRLRPLRNDSGEDEMVKLLGKPNDMIVA